MNSKLKIGYFLADVSLGSGGVAPYAWRVLELLLSKINTTNVELTLICSTRLHQDCLELISRHHVDAQVCILSTRLNYLQHFLRKSENVLRRIFRLFGINTAILNLLDPMYIKFSLFDIDLLHIPYQLPPTFNLPYPCIVTMHDVQELHFPEFFTPEERIFRAINYWNSLKYANGVIVSYNHVQDDLLKYFNIAHPKVNVCPPPFEHISICSHSPDEALGYTSKYKNLDSFILYPAQTWRHKNHLSLIKALELIKLRHCRSISLVCTGTKNSFFEDTISNYLLRSTVSHDILFTDIVPETELYWLYKNCSLVVIPTLYEAGSFPLLEAMILEVPVICSSVTSLPETIGDSRFIFDPLDTDGMSQLILEMLGNLELRQANVMNSRDRISRLCQVDSFQSMYTAWCNTLKGC